MELKNAQDIAIMSFIGKHLWISGILCLSFALFSIIADILNMMGLILKALYLTNHGTRIETMNYHFKFWVAPLWLFLGLLILLWR